MTDTKLQQLRTLLAEVNNLERAAAVLEWDQQTYMPAGGTAARAEHVATLKGLAHRRFVSAESGELLEQLQSVAERWDYESDDASLVRFAARQYRRNRRIPVDLVAAIARAKALGHAAWVEARAQADYGVFKPHLATMFDLKRQLADALAPYDHPYDPLLDEYEPGMTAADLAAMFASFKDELVDLIQAIAERPDAIDSQVLYGSYNIDQQRVFGEEIIRQFGYDFSRGRQDVSPHPFTTHFSSSDVRITTRYDENFLPSALFSTIHEAGHALYEQGVDPALDHTWLGEGTSLGIHESQSRLWENLIGRSRPFWMFAFPKLQATFPAALGDVDLETLYRAINRSAPSLIRVEADEVTYNLHILIRFELELALLTAELSFEDLPEAWNSKYESYLGLRPPDDAVGVLQDIHWSSGDIGYFPTYSIGNVASVQFLEKAREAIPDLTDQSARGEFEALAHWLQANIYRHGRKFTPPELIQRVTGSSLDSRPYMRYLQEKYRELYGL